MIPSPCYQCSIWQECESVYRRFMMSYYKGDKTSQADSHDRREFESFALQNAGVASCWNSPRAKEYKWRQRNPNDAYYIVQMMEDTIKARLILPLPPVGEPFQIYRHATYDYYGNLIEKDVKYHPEWVVDEYEQDVDHLQGLYWDYFCEKVRNPMERAKAVLPLSRTHDIPNIFNRLYGGFDFNALMRMVATVPRHFEEIHAAFEAWTAEEFRKFFVDFCEYAELHPMQIPEPSRNNMYENFHFNLDKFSVNDYLDFMDYPVGIELRDGQFFEMTGARIFSDWASGFAIKNFAAGVVGMQFSMEDAFSGKKRGFFEKIGHKIILERHRKSMEWFIHIREKGKETKRISIFDVVLFYPPPPGQPVPNPLG